MAKLACQDLCHFKVYENFQLWLEDNLILDNLSLTISVEKTNVLQQISGFEYFSEIEKGARKGLRIFSNQF